MHFSVSALLKGVISNDLQWLSEIFNDTKESRGLSASNDFFCFKMFPCMKSHQRLPSVALNMHDDDVAELLTSSEAM